MNKINFEKLISPVSTETFFQDFWEKEALHIERGQADRYASILSIEEIDSCLARHDLTPFYIRLFQDGQEIPLDDWVIQETIDDNTFSYLVNPSQLFAHFCAGATIIITHGEKSIHNLSDFCSDLGQELKTTAQANIYITPANSQGFLPHYDLREVFVLQVHGQKTWNLFESPEILPTKKTRKIENPKLIRQIRLETGDLLYLPRGTVHSAFSADTPSIHITLSFHYFGGWKLLETFNELSQKDLFFRRSIPNKFSTEREKKEYSDKFLKKTKNLLKDLESENLFERQYEDFVRKQFIDYKQNFSDLLSIDEIGLETKVARKQNLSYLIKHKDKELILKFGKQELSFPNFLLPTLENCFQNEPFEIKELKGLINDAGKIDIVKSLLKIGFLKIKKDQLT